MVMVFKSFSTVGTGIGDHYIFKQAISPGIIGSLAVMVASAIVASINDLEYNFVGYVWMACNCVLTTSYVVCSEKIWPLNPC